MDKYYLIMRDPSIYLMHESNPSTIDTIWLRTKSIKYRSLNASEFLGSTQFVEIDKDEYDRIKKEYI